MTRVSAFAYGVMQYHLGKRKKFVLMDFKRIRLPWVVAARSAQERLLFYGNACSKLGMKRRKIAFTSCQFEDAVFIEKQSHVEVKQSKNQVTGNQPVALHKNRK